MKIATLVVIALATTTSIAVAQPGNTAPTGGEMPPPPPDGSPPPAPPGDASGTVQAGPVAVDLDAILARVEAASPTLETIARGAFRRARRSISFGPTVGFWGAGVLAQDDTEYALTFGLGFEKFKVPVLPSMETLKALVKERAKAKLKDQILARFQGREPDPISAEQFAREVWEEAVQEILGLENVRAKTMERPALSLGLEVNRMFSSEAWAPRVRIGVGVWKFTVAGSFSVALGAEGVARTPVYLGAEVVTHFLTSKNPRASVVDVFLRMDFEMRSRETNTDQLVLGVRYLLDVI